MAHKGKDVLNDVLVIAPHPDDETLGCGGTLLKHKAAGARIHWLVVTGMTTKGGYTRTRIDWRKKEIDQVERAYGFSSVNLLNLPAARLDATALQDIITPIGKTIEGIRPGIVYLPSPYDIHSDHRVVHDAAMSCCKCFRFPSIRKVLLYEVMSETDFPRISSETFHPNSFSDISGFIDQKTKIMKMFAGEMGIHPFPRSEQGIRALATVRAAAAGCEFAEAFMLQREIW